MSLNQLASDIRDVNRVNGWKPFEPCDWKDQHKIPAILALIHSEASEALEGFRVDDKENFVEELADIVIRVLDCAGGIHEDFESVIHDKIEKNP